MAKKGRPSRSLKSIPTRSLTRRLTDGLPSVRVTRTAPVFTPQTGRTNRLDLSPLQVIEDRRLFHPLRAYSPSKRVSGSPARIVVADRLPTKRQTASAHHRRIRSQTKGVLTFAEPRETLVCIRRQRRKEVLFASGGAGKRNKRRPRRNAFSSISCR